MFEHENIIKALTETLKWSQEQKKDAKPEEQDYGDSNMWFLLLFALFFGLTPSVSEKESYLQGKVDAYEKVIRRLF